MYSLQKIIIEKVVSLINKKKLSLRDLKNIPYQLQIMIYERMFHSDYANWCRKMYHCQAELQISTCENHWTTWLVYDNLNGEREFFDEILIQVEADTTPVVITPHDNYLKWRVYRDYVDYSCELHQDEVEEFIDDFDY